MNSIFPLTKRSVLASLVLNAASLVAWWLIMFTWVRTQFPYGMTDWRTGAITILVACALGALAALSIRRLGAAYVLAGFVAMQSVEFMFHSQFGNRVVQGGPAHFATMAAAIIAVAAAAFVERNRKGLRKHLVYAGASFVAAELGIRIVFGFLWGMTGGPWRFRHLFYDGQTNYAILLSALVGSALGFMIARWGGLLAIHFPNRKRAAEIASS